MLSNNFIVVVFRFTFFSSAFVSSLFSPLVHLRLRILVFVFLMLLIINLRRALFLDEDALFVR